jgi:hypothetical protein
MELILGKTPATVRTFRVRGMERCMKVVEGLIGHRQWFTFRPLIHPTYFNDEYEFDFDPETPESGYSFEPTRDIDSGLERVAERVFFASGKWRMVDRFPWWYEYRDATPVIIGHYWRWPTAAARDAYSRGEPDLFKKHAAHHWFGARENVFCVDFAVGARYKERADGPKTGYGCRLAAVRWPERGLVFDDGRTFKLAEGSTEVLEAIV